MDTSAQHIARELGVSLPAVHRALDSLGVPRAGRGHVRKIPGGTLARMLATRGAAPRHPTPATELRVLAALSRAPLGLPSARSVAAQAGVSPTTASKALHHLAATNLTSQKSFDVASGRARRELRWMANTTAWSEDLRRAVRRTRLPHHEGSATALPRSLHHLFWNADVSKLTPDADGSYMAGRLLDAPDLRAWRWAFANIRPHDIDNAVSRRGVSPRIQTLVANWMRDE